VPGPLEGADPIVDGLERRSVDPVPAAASIRADEHQPDLPEHAEVLGHLLLAQPEAVDELSHGGLPGADGIEELATGGLRDGAERIGRGGAPGHAPIICRYRNVSTAAPGSRPNRPG